MEDLLYDEFDFSQYDPLANINAILEEIAQKNLEIEELATTMEETGNTTPEKETQIDIIEQEIQELKKQQPKQSKITTLTTTTTNNPKNWRT